MAYKHSGVHYCNMAAEKSLTVAATTGLPCVWLFGETSDGAFMQTYAC